MHLRAGMFLLIVVLIWLVGSVIDFYLSGGCVVLP